MASVLLPTSEAPIGRTLSADDHVEVTWTVHHPDDNLVEDRKERRRARLLRLVEEAEAQDAAPTIDHLATALGASSATVRRDIAELRKAGTTVNTRGHRS